MKTCAMNVNAPAQPFSGTMDVDEFMAFLETRPDGEHWELIEGVVVMMAPASYAHQRINRGQFTLKPASIEMGRGPQ